MTAELVIHRKNGRLTYGVEFFPEHKPEKHRSFVEEGRFVLTDDQAKLPIGDLIILLALDKLPKWTPPPPPKPKPPGVANGI